MKKSKLFYKGLLITFIVFVLIFTRDVDFAETVENNIVIGKRVKLYSEILEEERILEISLPANYQNSKVEYPVLFVLDGGNIFRYCVSVVRMIAPNHLPHLIVVGIPNTNRRRDLDPNDKKNTPPHKGASQFLKFMETELIPFIEKEYRALPFRLITGHSLAGFFTIHTFLYKPELFNAFIATSPSLWIPEDNDYLKKVQNILDKKSFTNKFLYFSVGEIESEKIIKGNQRFAEILKEKLVNGIRWNHDLLENEGHIPIKGFYAGMRELYKDWLISLELIINPDLKEIQKHYKTLSKSFGYKILPPESLINTLGYRLLNKKKIAEAIELFKYNVEKYPKSWNVYDSLGEAAMKQGDKPLALKSYQIALKLNPRKTPAEKRIYKQQEQTIKQLKEGK